tara:strand:- start:3322 stop:3579 length:258 start_codon:yes stop_codon:yes gene_type:complete
MTTTQITYGKALTIISQNLNTGLSKVFTSKVSNLVSLISDLECFAIRLNKTVLNKTIKKIEALGFSVDVDNSYGFEWEVKLYCSI